MGGVAFGNPQSFADGTMDNSTGNLYWYMSPMDASAQDIAVNSKVSWALSEQMLGGLCTRENVDAEDPRCTRCVFIGGMRSVTTAELEMESWPSDHNFAVYTMDIENIWLIDMFGGAS